MHLGAWMIELWLAVVMSQTGSTLSVAEVVSHETLVIQSFQCDGTCVVVHSKNEAPCFTRLVEVGQLNIRDERYVVRHKMHRVKAPVGVMPALQSPRAAWLLASPESSIKTQQLRGGEHGSAEFRPLSHQYKRGLQLFATRDCVSQL